MTTMDRAIGYCPQDQCLLSMLFTIQYTVRSYSPILYRPQIFIQLSVVRYPLMTNRKKRKAHVYCT